MMSESGINYFDDSGMIDIRQQQQRSSNNNMTAGDQGGAMAGLRSDDDELLSFPSPDSAGTNIFAGGSANGINSGGSPIEHAGYSPPVGSGSGMSMGIGACGSNRALSQFANAPSKMEFLKDWSISTYKVTKQALSEKLGKTVARTVDPEIEKAIDELKTTQQSYDQILRLARLLTSQFNGVVETQRSLGETFQNLAHSDPELGNSFTFNAKTQYTLAQNGESLLAALTFFVNSLNTLCHKTIEDTMLTVRSFESARLEYDAYRSDLELLQLQSTSKTGDYQAKIHDTQNTCAQHKQHYEQLKQDVQVKMKFLHENRVKVMEKHLVLFHNAVSAYFSGNKSALDAALSQFNIKIINSEPKSSFLEQ